MDLATQPTLNKEQDCKNVWAMANNFATFRATDFFKNQKGEDGHWKGTLPFFQKKCDRTSNTTTQAQAAPTALPQPHAQAQSTATNTEHNHKHRPQPQPLEQPQLARAIRTTNLWNSNSDNRTNRAYTFEPKPVAKVQCSMILW